MVILIGIAQGIGAEAVFCDTLAGVYPARASLSGMGSSVTSFIYDLFVSGYSVLNPGLLAVMLLIRLISGALLAGLLGKAISDALAYTGVLNGMALGKQFKKKKKQVNQDAGI